MKTRNMLAVVVAVAGLVSGTASASPIDKPRHEVVEQSATASGEKLTASEKKKKLNKLRAERDRQKRKRDVVCVRPGSPASLVQLLDLSAKCSRAKLDLDTVREEIESLEGLPASREIPGAVIQTKQI
jgi:hypothetical protein